MTYETNRLCLFNNYMMCIYLIFQFFTQNTASDDTFTPNAPEFDFDEMENNVRYLNY